MTPAKKRIGIFVIAYNAVNKLDWTLDRIPDNVWEKVEEVFLFDDCSTDNRYYAALGYKHASSSVINSYSCVDRKLERSLRVVIRSPHGIQ